MTPNKKCALFLIAALVTLAIGALAVDAACCGVVLGWDDASQALFDKWHDSRIDRIVIALTWLGSLFILLPISLLMIWWPRNTSMPHSALFIMAALIAASSVAHAWKLVIDRARPDAYSPLITMPYDASYPSAHAMQATAFFLAWSLQPGKRATSVKVVMACFAIMLIGLSRIYLQVHYLSDVVFGVLASILLVLGLRNLPYWTKAAH